ncbi:MAG: type II toxin-antitoxin system mRNA interferase toxin, RelE/StbE family [Gammaproteobacteria bacterium]|nr:type II toxin-antitoxin system mRNA interferase toxin, RelE/StbE family [Gammaproteobacteria bacterium]
MAWTIEYTDKAKRRLKKLDKPIARRIVDYMDAVGELDDPRTRGKRLSGPLGDFWRYRIDDYRAICVLQDGRMVVLVLLVDHRSKAYREH